MPDRLSPPMLRLLQGAACVVIIMWGVRTASHLLGLVLLGILLAYSFLPLPKWIMRRFKLEKNAAIGLAVALAGTVSLVTVLLLFETTLRLRERLPVYHEHFMGLYEKVLVFSNAHGINLASLPSRNLSSSDRILELSRVVLPEAAGLLSDGLLISALGLVFLIELVEQAGSKRGALAEGLYYYGGDTERYIAISAKTGAITALANLVLLLALDVDFPILWCVLYFFLRFIPNLGFIIALVPPTFLALLMFGWQRALLVASGLILTNLVADYVLSPIFMKKGVDVSFLEITLSLLLWGGLLGLAGGILAIPLTLALRKVIDKQSNDGGLARAPSG